MVKVSKFLGQGKVLWTTVTWLSRIYGPPDCIQGNTGPGQAVGGDIGSDDSPLTEGKKKKVSLLQKKKKSHSAAPSLPSPCAIYYSGNLDSSVVSL